MKLLVIAEQSGGQLRSTTLSAIAFAKKVGGEFSILVMGAEGSASAAAALAGFGAAEVLHCQDASLGDPLAERYAPTVIQLGAEYDVLVATASTFGKDLMPRVAGGLDAGFAGDCSDVSLKDGKLSLRRPMFAGNAFGSVTISGAVAVVTVRQSEFGAAAPEGGNSAIRGIPMAPAGAAAARIEFVSMEQVKNERPELAEAAKIVSGGRALKEKFFDVLEPLADALGAGIGASRAACDAGYAPGDFQVGQTGKIVAPQLYVAVGISGAIQHIAGMKGSKTIVAINKDPDAPIFQISDYGLVADLFEAVPAFVTELQKG